MNQYEAFFDDLFESDTPRHAIIDGQQVRVLIGRTSNEYAINHGVAITGGSLDVTMVKMELPEGWKPKPNARLTVNNRQYQIYQDVPVQELDPEGVLIKITIHPV